jgi:hypothetical protein
MLAIAGRRYYFSDTKLDTMKSNVSQKFLQYMYSNFTGNFIGFAIGMASTRLVAHFFTTRKLGNLWGLAAKKAVVDKETYSGLEWMISVVIGFLVFEIISKYIKKKMNPVLLKYKGYLPADWVDEEAALAAAQAMQPVPVAQAVVAEKPAGAANENAG